MKVHVTDLKPGDRLMTDTFNSVGLHILPGGTVVRREEISLLIRHRLDYVSIQVRQLAGGAEEQSHGLHNEFDQVIMNYEATFLEALSQGCFTPALVDATPQPLLATLDKQRTLFRCCCCLTVKILIRISTPFKWGCCLTILPHGLVIRKRSATGSAVPAICMISAKARCLCLS